MLNAKKTALIHSSQTGDTIVEVLFCIAVITVVVTATYVAVNNNYKSFEETQERARAVKLLETQVEDLRSYTGNQPFDCFAFSYDATEPTQSVVNPDVSTGGQGTNPCILQSDGTQASATSIPAYFILITKSAAASPTYTISATWQGPDRAETATVEYRTQ